MKIERLPIYNLKLQEVSFAYDRAKPLFEKVSFEFPDARAIWVRSPGGRGKSTLLRMLVGLLTPGSGNYFVNGESVGEMSFEQFLPLRLSMGYSFDMGGLLNNKTISDNLILPLVYHNILSHEEAAQRVLEVTDSFGMSQTRDLRPYAVPGSQRKLACVVRSMIHWPQVLFLDDPVTGLKEDNLNDLLYYVEESFGSRGLKQVIFTGENPTLAKQLKAEELLISSDWFTMRTVA